MGENTSNENLLEKAARLQAQFEAEEAAKQKAQELLQKAMDDVQAKISAAVEEYQKKPSYKKAIDTLAQEQGTGPNNIIFQIALQDMGKTEEYAVGTGARAALAGLTSNKSLKPSPQDNAEVAAVSNYLKSDENTDFKPGALIANVKEIFAGKRRRRSDHPQQQQEPQVQVKTGQPARQQAPAVSVNDDVLTSANIHVDTGQPASKPVGDVPDFTGAGARAASQPGPAFGQRTNEDVEKDIKQLHRDLRKVQAAASSAATQAAGSRKYKNVARETDYLTGLSSRAMQLKDHVATQAYVLSPTEGSKAVITVNDENREGYDKLLHETKTELNTALVQFEAAKHAISKARRRQPASDRAASAMLKTLTKNDGQVNMDELNDALTPPSKWKSTAAVAGTSLVTLTLMAVMAMRGGGMFGETSNAGNRDDKARAMAGLDPEEKVAPPEPRLDRKDPDIIAPNFGGAPEAEKPAPEVFKPNFSGDEKVTPPTVAGGAGEKDPVMPADGAPAMPADGVPAGMPPAGMPPAGGAPAAVPGAMVDGAPKPIDPAVAAAPAAGKIDVSQLDEAELREFVKKTVLPHLKSEYANPDDKNPVMSVFKGDKWKVEYAQTAEWHKEAAKAKRAGDPEPMKRNNGGMLFISNSNGSQVLPVVLGNTNTRFKILDGKSYHRRDGEALMLTLGGRATAEIGDKVVAPAVSVHDDVLNGANVRLAWPVERGTAPKSELQYVGVPLTRVPHVDKDIALRIVAPIPQKGERVNDRAPIQTYSVSLGAIDPQHEKFSDTGRKTYTVITEGPGTLAPGVLYKEVGPFNDGEINRYKALKGLTNYDGFKTRVGYAGPLIPHQVQAKGTAAPAWIRVAPSSRQYLQGEDRQDHSTIYIEEQKEIEVAGKNKGDPREVIMATNPVAYAFGGPRIPDNGPVVEKFINQEDVGTNLRRGYFSKLMNNVDDVGGLAFERIDARYDDEYSRSGRRLSQKRGQEQFEIVGRPIDNVTVYARNGGYNPRTSEGVPVIRINGVSADQETMLKLKDAVEREADKRVMDKGANIRDLKKGPVYVKKMGDILEAPALQLERHERSDLTHLFASGQETVKIALEGDEKTAASKLLDFLRHTMRKEDLVAAVRKEGPNSPNPSDDVMVELVKNFRQAVKSGEVDKDGLKPQQQQALSKNMVNQIAMG